MIAQKPPSRLRPLVFMVLTVLILVIWFNHGTNSSRTVFDRRSGPEMTGNHQTPDRERMRKGNLKTMETKHMTDGGKETILVVDDEKAILDITGELLKVHGYNVLKAESGEVALELFARDQHIDLVIMDLGMPGMGGRRCLKEIKKIRPGARVIISSGDVTEAEDPGHLESGASAFVHKPYRLEKLLETIREVLAAGSADETG